MRPVPARVFLGLRAIESQQGDGRQGLRSRDGRTVRLYAPDRRLSGGQAEYVRVPYADVGPLKIENGLTDEQVLFLSDIFPTGWQAVVQSDIEPTDTVAIWGCGPVGQFCIRSASLLGAKRVIAIDRVPERLAMAEAAGPPDGQLRGRERS